MAESQLSTLIDQVEAATPEATALHRITAAQLRARVLADLGEQLMGHFVSQAKSQGASWSQIGEALGVSKQAAQQRSFDGFARYTDWARQAVVHAQESARTAQHDHIGTEHLLVGLLRERRGLAAQIVSRYAGSAEAADDAAAGLLGPGSSRPVNRLQFDPTARAALERSIELAAELGHDFVGTEHLLLGVLEADDATARLLRELGLEPTTARTEVSEAVAALSA